MSERLAPEQGDSLEGIVEPGENPRLIGHIEAIESVVGAYRAGKLHHALLLTGPRGVGKATFAFQVARYLLENPDANSEMSPFGFSSPDSSIFRQVASGAHPGVLHLTRPFDERGKKFKTAITVDEMRRVSRFLSLRSHDGSYRIIIVDPAEDMNRNAANALLKNLEEPPPRVLFLLISHSPGSLLPTIRSRCQVLRFQPLKQSEIDAVLSQPGIALPQDAVARQTLLEGAQGSARNAILMAAHGGADIIAAADACLDALRKDPLNAYKLADSVSGRDHEVRFDILNSHLLARITTESTAAAMSGDTRRAAHLAELWNDVRSSIAETVTYNLDKRQHIVGLLSRISSAIAQ
jgi:DNA polymerase-3 subunit delta'